MTDKAVTTLPRAQAQIAILASDIAERDRRVALLEEALAEARTVRENVEKRYLSQSQELATTRKSLDAMADARLEAQMGFARAIGYIAALKGEPFNADDGRPF